jgi:hypothetical protein
VTPHLPQSLRDFLTSHFRSPLQLRVLLLLHRHQAKWWSAGAVAAALQVMPDCAGRVLEELGGANLLDVKIGDRVRYRYAPLNPVAAAVIDELSGVHQGAPGVLEAALADSIHVADAERWGTRGGRRT